MNLTQVIHECWAADAALCQVLPAARVSTGMSGDPSVPYAVISRRSQRPVARLGDGSTVDRIGLRIEVFHDRYDTGTAIVQRLKAALHLAEVPLSGSDKVLCIQRSNDLASQHDDGLWQFVVDFDCTVYLDSGV